MYVGMTEPTISDSKLRVYPNPSAGNITLETESLSATNIQIDVSDLTGRKLKTETWKTNAGKNIKSLDLSGFTSGIYFITLSGEKSEIVGRKKILLK